MYLDPKGFGSGLRVLGLRVWGLALRVGFTQSEVSIMENQMETKMDTSILVTRGTHGGFNHQTNMKTQKCPAKTIALSRDDHISFYFCFWGGY